MEKSDGITDVGEMKDRMMIDLFKKKLQEAKTDLGPIAGDLERSQRNSQSPLRQDHPHHGK